MTLEPLLLGSRQIATNGGECQIRTRYGAATTRTGHATTCGATSLDRVPSGCPLHDQDPISTYWPEDEGAFDKGRAEDALEADKVGSKPSAR